MDLAYLTRGVNLAGEGDQRAATPGLRAGGDPNGVPEVARAVGVRVVGPALGARQDDRRLASEHAVDEVDALLHRVGAVRHHDARDVVPGHVLLDAAGKGEHEVAVDVEAGDLREVVELDRRSVGRGRSCPEQLFAADGRDELPGRGVGPHGDRAAGGDDDDGHRSPARPNYGERPVRPASPSATVAPNSSATRWTGAPRKRSRSANTISSTAIANSDTAVVAAPSA